MWHAAASALPNVAVAVAVALALASRLLLQPEAVQSMRSCPLALHDIALVFSPTIKAQYDRNACDLRVDEEGNRKEEREGGERVCCTW